MKKSIVRTALNLSLSILIVGGSTPVSLAAQCLFGEETHEFNPEDGEPKVLAKMKARGLKVGEKEHPKLGELLDEVADDALTALIADLLGEERHDRKKRSEYWKDFFRTDGYFQYITQDGDINWGYIVVAAYPGDNEHGAIFQIRPYEDGIYSLKKVADIGDGYIENCKAR